MSAPTDDAPLAPLRVLDLTQDAAGIATRLLADLGADVLKVEPPGGSHGRQQKPTVFGVSVPFALQNANKRSAILDPSADGSDPARAHDHSLRQRPECLIAVEAEMNKVSWPSWNELVRWSMVVIIMIFTIGFLLFGFDAFWVKVFQLIGVLPTPKGLPVPQ